MEPRQHLGRAASRASRASRAKPGTSRRGDQERKELNHSSATLISCRPTLNPSLPHHRSPAAQPLTRNPSSHHSRTSNPHSRHQRVGHLITISGRTDVAVGRIGLCVLNSQCGQCGSAAGLHHLNVLGVDAEVALVPRAAGHGDVDVVEEEVAEKVLPRPAQKEGEPAKGVRECKRGGKPEQRGGRRNRNKVMPGVCECEGAVARVVCRCDGVLV